MKIVDWERLANAMPEADLSRFADAIATLKDWPTFRQEFAFTGIFTLETILRCTLENRPPQGWGEIPAGHENGAVHVLQDVQPEPEEPDPFEPR